MTETSEWLRTKHALNLKRKHAEDPLICPWQNIQGVSERSPIERVFFIIFYKKVVFLFESVLIHEMYTNVK